jgi:hypothetical protein
MSALFFKLISRVFITGIKDFVSWAKLPLKAMHKALHIN